MTVPEILKALETYTGRFPMKAMRAAIEAREAITPELLRALESVAEDPEQWAKRQDYMLHVFAVHLLAQFRERRAFPPLVKIVSAPGEVPFDLFGDTITEGLPRLLGSLYDGNQALLHGLIVNERVNEFVRSAAIRAFLVLEESGQMSRDEVVGYFRSLFHGGLARTPSFAWSSLACVITELPAPELLPELRQAYADQLADEQVADLAGLERDILSPNTAVRENHRLITDAIDEMAWWASFHPDESRPRPVSSPPVAVAKPPPPVFPSEHDAPVTYVREQPKVGRNDPCPCGSGRKYKKCCGKG